MLSVRFAIAMVSRPLSDLGELAKEYYIKRGVFAALIRRCENLINDASQQDDDGSAIFGEEPVVTNVSAGCKRILGQAVESMRRLASQ